MLYPSKYNYTAGGQETEGRGKEEDEQCHLMKEQAQEKLTLYEDRKQKGEPDR